ncbi:MAG: pirin family protein [Chitinophagaceae bacterium]|nr:pirin family protein [Chitinophagaceae bacterium]
MKTILFPAKERGQKNIGWLQSNFLFSFSNYYNPACSSFGTLIAFNDDVGQPGKGFGLHPHQNMEIISVLLKGKMNHKDSTGYSSEIEAGGVQIMSAGSGLFHEEYNIGDTEVNFLQILIQPKVQNIRPRYQHRHFPKEKRENKLVTMVSKDEGFGHCWINQNAKLSLGYFTKEESLEYKFNPENKCVFLFCIEGQLSVENVTLNRRDAIGIWDTESMTIGCEKNSEFLIIETVINQK